VGGIEGQRVPACALEIGAVHEREGSRLRGHDVEDVDVMQRTLCHRNDSGDMAAQIKTCVPLDSRCGLSKPRSRTEGEAQVDCGGIKRTNGMIEIQVVRMLARQMPRRMDQVLGQGGGQPPVPDRVRMGQRVAPPTTTETHRVERVCLGSPTHLDIAQTGSSGQLRKRHTPVVVAARERFDCVIARLLIDNTMEAMPREMIHDLRKNKFARRHCPSPFFSD